MRWNIGQALTGIAVALAATAMPEAAQTSRPGAAYFPNVTLTTQDGATVRFYDDLIKGKIVAVNLIYTTCKYACPLETARLAQVQTLLGDRMGREVFFYSITIDPEHDTPAVLKEYAGKFHAGPGWLFLTGRQDDIDLIGRKLGLSARPAASNPDGHAPSLLVGNEATGQWMRNSGVDNPKFLARTIGDWLTSWQGPRKTLPSYANAAPLALDRGEYVFKSHCAACHTIGQGDRIGPDLLGVTNTREREWLARFIAEPDRVREAGDPIAQELYAKYKAVRMPNLSLGRDDVDQVMAYLEKQTAAAPAVAAAPALGSNFPVPSVIEAYLQVQEALSADRLQGAKEAARRIAQDAPNLGANGGPVQAAAEALQSATDLKDARAAFGGLSDAIITCAKALNVSPGEGVNVAYCPMARKYWLQKGTAIRNPYYGKSMLECGRIETRLPDIKK